MIDLFGSLGGLLRRVIKRLSLFDETLPPTAFHIIKGFFSR